jgi:2-polyprenyl-6-methoxyphenol hydroxylase-like FAD-dependent oxidoreductase
MSPVGGVGINYAIQDAVVAANVLSEPLKAGKIRLRDLAEVQRQREWPTRIIQGFQNFIQRTVVANVVNSNEPIRVSPFLRFLLRMPVVRDLPAQFIAFGPRSVHLIE